MPSFLKYSNSKFEKNYFQGVYFYHSKKYQSAINSLKKALKQDTKNENFQITNTYGYLLKSYEIKKDYLALRNISMNGFTQDIESPMLAGFFNRYGWLTDTFIEAINDRNDSKNTIKKYWLMLFVHASMDTYF